MARDHRLVSQIPRKVTSPHEAEVVFYACISGFGLLATVYAMLHGTVRQGHEPGAIRFPIAGFNAPVIGFALFAFGAAGYLFNKYSQFDTIVIFIIAILAAAAAWIAVTVLMARWAMRGPLNDPHEELEELQGTIATVTCPITPLAPGEIAYSFRGAPATARARSLSGESVPAGTDVVIDRIDNGIADVELWSVVEQRL